MCKFDKTVLTNVYVFTLISPKIFKQGTGAD